LAFHAQDADPNQQLLIQTEQFQQHIPIGQFVHSQEEAEQFQVDRLVIGADQVQHQGPVSFLNL
jgi:hypothetical protein